MIDQVIYENDFIVIHSKVQIDFSPEGMPYVGHHKYPNGSRRVSYGKTPQEALVRGITNIILYPLEDDKLLTNEVMCGIYPK